MASNHELRLRARASLGFRIFGDTWLLANLAILVITALGALASSTGIGMFLVVGPLNLGMAATFLRIARGKRNLEASDFIKGFTSDFVENFLLGLLSGLFIFLWSLLLVIPGIVKGYAYSMIYFIKNDHPEYDWRKCLSESERIMSGNKWKLFCLDFSFLGWLILGGMCFGIGTLWVVAYMQTARAHFYEAVK